MCLCSTFTREGLRSAEQGLVLHGLIVHNWHVQLRKGDVTHYHTLDFCSRHLLPPPVNLSNANNHLLPPPVNLSNTNNHQRA